MNNLLTNINGGFPFVLDDLRWLYTANKEIIRGILESFNIPSNKKFILNGCETSTIGNPATHYSINAGFVYIDGEVYKVDSHTIPIFGQMGGNGYYWDIDISYDPSGLKTFENGNQYNTYEVRKAKVVFGQLPNDYLAMNGPRLIDLITSYVISKLPQYIEPVNFVGQVGQPSFYPGWNHYIGQESVGFYKDNENKVYIQGMAIRNFGQNTIFTLPSGYRPQKNRNFITTGSDWLGATIVISTVVMSNGNILVSNLTNANQIRGVSLDGIVYRI